MSKNKTTLYAQPNNMNSISTVFYFKEGSSGSNISGFTIVADKAGIIVNNSNNIKIFNNNIINASDSSIIIENSKNIEINHNNIEKNNEGINIKSSENILINKNNIRENKGNGIRILSSKNSKIASNNIENNNKSGISLQKTSKIEISNNNLNENKVNGIELIENTENTYISKNNISRSSRGILIDSVSKNDTIISNNIKTNLENGNEDQYHNAIGILFGYTYTDRNEAPTIESNAFYGNSRFSIRANIDLIRVKIGSNWYGSNYESYSGLCPKITSNLITAKLVKSNNGYKLIFYDGDKVANNLASFNVIFSDGENKKTISVKNGVAAYNSKNPANLVSVWVDRDIISVNGNSNDPNQGIYGFDSSAYDTGNGTENIGIDNSPSNSKSFNIASKNPVTEGDSKSNNPKEIFIEDKNPLKIEDNPYLSYVAIVLILSVVFIGYMAKKR
ncbi:MAG: right-handed parallel beta-helix repeat-containing protein [Methanobrevibacter sp.]|nr:right-handed parallel beta-helix repeat-containing protein [Methanobrevibacter sp.]